MVTHEDVVMHLKQPREQAIGEIERAVIALAKAGEDMEIKEIEVALEFSAPAMIVFWGDWHIGDKACLLQKLLDDKEVILTTEGVYFIGMGDYRCNLTRAPFRSSNREILPPGWQDMLALRYAEELRGKALGWLAGCHDFWQVVQGDVDFLPLLCERSEAHHLWHQAIVNLEFPNARYRGVVRHKASRESNINTTNAQRAMYERWGNPDFVALGHKHYGDLQFKGKADKCGETAWVRSGTYLWMGEWSQRLGDYFTEAVFPGIVFWAGGEKMMPFRDFKDGLPLLKQLRASVNGRSE